MKTEFPGFPRDIVQFLAELRENNTRDWFQANKSRYRDSVDAPSKDFLDAMAMALQTITGDAVDGKIFRIYRDVRFGKDKTPYNPHVRMAFATSRSHKEESCDSPAFYLSLEPEKLVLGGGVMAFSKQTLSSYREAVDSPEIGDEIVEILATLTRSGFRTNEPEYKKVPRGWDPAHPRSNLLRCKGLTVWRDSAIPKEIYSAEGIDWALVQYQRVLPLYSWLNRNCGVPCSGS